MNYCDSPRRPSPGFPPYHEWVHSLYEPLRAVTKRTLKGFPKVARWSEADDVLHGALVRLLRALPEAQPASQQQLFALGAKQVRREFLDLARRYSGQTWQALHAPGPAPDPVRATDRSEMAREFEGRSALHDALGKLSADHHEFLRLLISEGKNQDEVAALLHLSVRTVQRRWATLLQTLRSLLTRH